MPASIMQLFVGFIVKRLLCLPGLFKDMSTLGTLNKHVGHCKELYTAE